MTKRNTSSAGYDDGAFGAYVRQLGDLTRLSVEEEVFHATNFADNRRLFLRQSCWFPAALGKIFREARQTEVSFNSEEENEEDRQSKRERLASTIATIEAVAEQFSAAEDDPDGDRRRELAAATLARAIGRVQLATNLCHQLFGDLHQCAARLGLPSSEASARGNTNVDEAKARRLLHYRESTTPGAWEACIPSYRAMEKARDVLV